MSRIVRPRTFGSPEVLEVREVADRSVGRGEVAVMVRAAGVNPIDWKLYSGAFHAVDERSKASAGLDQSLPALGLECAGTVAEIGPGVEGVELGNDVVVLPVTGAYADRVVVPASALLAKPAALGWPEAGGLLLAGTTAAHALHVARMRPEETVLVHGGAGGVGLMAVQLARLSGARVVATASARNHALLRELGALPVTYGLGLADRVRVAAPQGVDAALDLVGTDEALDVSLDLVADPGRVVSVTGSDRRVGTGVRLLGYGPGQDPGTEVRAAARAGLVARAGTGELRVVIAATFPLEDAARAHELGRREHAPGKIVLLP